MNEDQKIVCQPSLNFENPIQTGVEVYVDLSLYINRIKELESSIEMLDNTIIELREDVQKKNQESTS